MCVRKERGKRLRKKNRTNQHLFSLIYILEISFKQFNKSHLVPLPLINDSCR